MPITLYANIDFDEKIIAKHIALYYQIANKHKDDNPKIAMEAMKNIERLKKTARPTNSTTGKQCWYECGS